MSKYLLLLFCGIVFTLKATSAPPQSTTTRSSTNLLLILDASGSMWGQIQGENKIVIARRVLKNVINGLGDDAKVGLVAYGHRREKDCEDIEIVSPLAPLNKAALAQQVDALNPKGKTPITGAIRKAFESLSPEQGATTIVLVSDGIETCGGDPCKTVSEAKAGGIDFVMHVIGFDVSKENVSQLECAAQAGGGLYFNAENADDLAAALDRAVEAPVDSSNAFFSIKAIANGALTDARVTLYRPGTREEVASGRTYEAATTNPRLFPVLAGEYDIEARAIKFEGDVTQTLANVAVAAGDTVAKEFDFSIGELAVTVTRNGNLSDATVQVYAAGTQKNVAASRTYRDAKTNPTVFELTPGTYEVVIGSVEISGDVKKRIDSVIVQGGARSAHAHNFESGTLRVGAIHSGGLVDAVVRVLDASAGGSGAVAQGRTYTSEKSNPKSFEVQPGRYRVSVKAVKAAGKAEKEIDVSVAAGQTVEQIVDFGK